MISTLYLYVIFFHLTALIFTLYLRYSFYSTQRWSLPSIYVVLFTLQRWSLPFIYVIFPNFQRWSLPFISTLFFSSYSVNLYSLSTLSSLLYTALFSTIYLRYFFHLTTLISIVVYSIVSLYNLHTLFLSFYIANTPQLIYVILVIFQRHFQ